MYTSELNAYKTSTHALMEDFKSGKLYHENSDVYFAKIVTVCNHFKRGINNVEKALNSVIIASQGLRNDPDAGTDFVYDVFEVLDDYVDYICGDFQDFKLTVTNIVVQELFAWRCSVDFNLVEQRVSNLDKDVNRVRVELLSQFMNELSDEQLKNRAV